MDASVNTFRTMANASATPTLMLHHILVRSHPRQSTRACAAKDARNVPAIVKYTSRNRSWCNSSTFAAMNGITKATRAPATYHWRR
jgi:hypothetical protein